MELTEEQIAYARTYVECAIRKRQLCCMTNERLEDVVMYCLERLVGKWKNYDPQRTTWKTYIVLCLSCTVKDAIKWYWRQYGRLPLLPIPEGYDTPVTTIDMDDEIDRIFPEPILNEMVKLKYSGTGEYEILQILKMKKVEYNQNMEIIHDRLAQAIKGDKEL